MPHDNWKVLVRLLDVISLVAVISLLGLVDLLLLVRLITLVGFNPYSTVFSEETLTET